MNALLVGPLFKLVEEVLDRVIPDRAHRETAKIEMKRALLEKQAEYVDAAKASDAGQVQINVAETASPDLFKSGWRPATGWVGVCGLAYQFVLHPMLVWLSPELGFASPPPQLDITDLMFLLTGMLGLGTLRTIEKREGVA